MSRSCLPFRSRAATSLGLALALTAVAAARAQEPGATAPSDPVFSALLVDGQRLDGRLVQLGPDGTLVLDLTDPKAGPPRRTLPLAQVVTLTRLGGEPPPSWPEGSLAVFPDGDRLRAFIDESTDAAVTVRPPALDDAATAVPLDHLLGLVLDPPADPDAAGALRARVRTEPRTSEVLWLGNGDRLAGGLLGLGAMTIAFEPDTGKVEVPRSTVVAVGFDPSLAQYPRPEGTYLELAFTDGSRLGVSGARLEQGHLVGTARFGAEVRPAVTALAGVTVRSPAVAYLSERAPAASEFVGYLAPHPGTFGRDATWDGHPLRLAGRPYDRGLGMLPRTLVAYKLDARDRRFQALVGLDERAGERGSVVCRVLVDGRERFASPVLTRRQEPVPVDVDVAGGRLLILTAEFGGGGDVQDSADWADARLIRAPE